MAADPPGFRRLPPPRREKLAHHIAGIIREKILIGEFPENSALPAIKNLTAQLGVSQASAREALRVLEGDGYLYMKTGPGGGPIVRHPGDDKVTKIVAELLQLKKTKLRDLHELRYYIEIPCARIAARNRTPDDLERLRQSLSASRQAPTNAEFLQHTVQFHQIIADCSQNRLLRLFFGCLRDLVYAAFIHLHFEAPWRAAETQEHQKIYNAIAAQDEAAAERWMRRHLEGFESVLSEWFEQYLEKFV